jgi:hypothetical protein
MYKFNNIAVFSFLLDYGLKTAISVQSKYIKVIHVQQLQFD